MTSHINITRITRRKQLNMKSLRAFVAENSAADDDALVYVVDAKTKRPVRALTVEWNDQK